MAIRYNLPSDEWAHLLVPTFIVGAADPDFPVANISAGNPASYFQAAGTSFTLSYDRGTPVTSGLISLIHGNLTGTAVWKRNTAPDFSGTGEVYPFTLPSIDADGYYDAPWVDCSAGPARRYEGLVVAGNALNVIIGQLWAGSVSRALANGFIAKPAPNFGDYRPRVPPLATVANVTQVFQNQGRQRYIAGTIKDSPTNLNALRDWQRSAGGEDQPILVILDDTIPTSSWFARWKTNVSPTQPNTDHQDYNVSGDYPLWYAMPAGFMEVAKGRPLGSV